MLRETNEEWNGGNGRWCRACKQAIEEGQPSVRLNFAHDPQGFGGLTGDYHTGCSKPFASIGRALDSLSRLAGGF